MSFETTPSQKFITGEDIGPLRKYRQMTVGADCGWPALVKYEVLTGLLGPMPGALGYYLRQKGYPFLLEKMGPGVAIGRNVTIRHPGRISLGRNVAIDDNVLLEARDGRITIGDGTIIARNTAITTRGGEIHIGANCNIGSGVRLGTLARLVLEDYVLIAAGCYVGGGNHRHDRLDVPIISQGMEEQKGVSVGRGAWLGAKAMVLDGAAVGHDAIIGAAALVNGDIPPRAVAVGQPAKVVRLRGEK